MSTIVGLITVCTAVGLFSLLFVTPALMCMGLVKISNEFELSIKDRILCCIPVFNYFYSWNMYSGSYFSLSGVGYLFASLMTIIRVGMYFNVPFESGIHLVTVYIWLIAVVMSWILHSIHLMVILKDDDYCPTWKKIVMSVTIIFGQIYVGFDFPRLTKYYSEMNSSSDLYG